MRRNTNVALVSLGLLLGTAGCDSFLTGNKLSENPNLPTAASITQLFVGVQAGQFAFEEGTVAMMMCEWVQACSATNGRFVQNAAQYNFGEGSNLGANSGDWTSVYAGGGLIDIRQVEADAQASGDSSWLGVAKIWEAFTMGTASAMWGNIPYSEAVSGKTAPALDNRFVILGNLQTLLDQAIAELTNGSGAGPGATDLVFHGDRAKWIRVAYTLKARYYLETAESLGTPAYTLARDTALKGISDPSGDFSSFHTTATSERNMWAQFQTSSGFGLDLEAGKALVDYMLARGDPRVPEYFCKNVTTAWKKGTKYAPPNLPKKPVGSLILDSNGNVEEVTAVAGDSSSGAAEPTWATALNATTTDNNVTWTNRGIPYVGDDFNTPPRLPASGFGCQPPRFADAARIPYVTYVENELILAEASAQLADEPSARTHLNNAYATVPGLASTAGVATGAALMDSIMMEKFVSMFQNIESISDYRRTCIPALVPSKNSFNFTHVPGRLYYPQNERNVNTNIPDASTQLATHGFRNAGDVHACQGSDNVP
jgi:hypothetical protein